MATYRAIASSETQPEAPLTADLLEALRQNPNAIAEADSTVPLSLLPTVHLGTITGNGSAQTLTGLDLTPFKGLRVVWNGVATSFGFVTVTIAQVGVGSFGSIPRHGIVTYDLQSGICSGVLLGADNVGTVITYLIAGLTTITTATTSISATAFSAGSVRFYGLK